MWGAEVRMKEFSGKVAVITGGASGIGRAMAERFAKAGMKIVLADVEERALAAAAGEIAASGAETLAVRTDVSKGTDVEALAKAALGRFGAVHVVCNNAGVAVSALTWDYTVADWEWVLGVNLWGVIHGVRVFTPILLEQGVEGHIVNTASLAGLISGGAAASYNVSKFGVVTLSETMHQELLALGAPVRVSVLCPGFVSTRIADSNRNRPTGLADTARVPEGFAQMEALGRQFIAAGSPPAMIAERVFEAVRDERFYILPHPDWKDQIQARMENILAERNPTPPDLQALLARLLPGAGASGT
jgi:NAD(P)-dependent dehydrogenase (short-subunit alcohol dehydrogenase family)